MLRFFYISIGGAIGAVLRYCISGLAHQFLSGGFPWGTLSVNLLGSLIIGFFWGMFESVVVSQDIRLFLFIGVIGSFTTFATFSLESFNLLRDGEYVFFALNVAASVLFGIALIFVGYFISRYMFNIIR